jgi:predicted TPR repeat methyltransferase
MNKISLQLLRDLNGWIRNTIVQIVAGDNEKAAWTLQKIIETMENQKAIDNLKAILTVLTNEEDPDDAA